MTIKKVTFRLGHPAYPRNGMNRCASHSNYRDALKDLLGRKVPMADAHRALRAALNGSLSSAHRYFKGTRVECCEVLADLH